MLICDKCPSVCYSNLDIRMSGEQTLWFSTLQLYFLLDALPVLLIARHLLPLSRYNEFGFGQRVMTGSEEELKKEVKKRFCELIEDDYTELWMLSALLYEEQNDLTSERNLEIVKEIVGELIEETGIYVVDIETELRAEMTRHQIFSQIELIFAKTNGRPSIGDGLWFSIDS